MGKELVISSNRHETKVAILEDDQLVEVYFQRANEYSLAGSIHKGRVTRVLPGMQSAFVDIGLERDAFLYVSDFFEDNEEYDKLAAAAEDKALKATEPRTAGAAVSERPAAPAAAPPPAPAPVPPAPAAAEPPAARSFEREHEDDRRGGRRSRRRRQRGRGFPEAKYADLREPAPPPPSGPADADFMVLPGESLAKYGRSAEPEAELDQATIEAAPELAGAEPDQTAEPAGAAREEAGAVTAEEAQEPVSAVTVAEAPAAEEESPAATAEEAERSAAEPQEEEPEANGIAADEPLPDAEPVGPGGLVTLLPDQAIPDAAAEGEPEGEAEPPSEGSPEEPAAEEVEPARMPVSLTATLREQGYKYPHRMSRRMRRKMRSGQGFAEQPEARTEPEPAEARPNGRTRQERVERPERERPPQPSISELLREGQEILVQIAKEPLGQKGARITSHIALPGRYVVFMPTVEHLGVSRKIASDEERLRLKRILQNHRAGIPGGFIVRTAGEGRSEQEIAGDMQYLFNLWLDIRQKAETRPAPTLIHHDLDLVSRILRDQMTDNFKAVWVDNEEIYEQVVRFVERFQPAAVMRVKLYTRDTPIFDAFNVSSELEKALRPKVWLKSGGYIVINQTEALVAIDVNTGKFVGKSNRLEDTIVKTNTEAVKEIVRQIRLRDLGGIIVVDFIDMDERKNRQKVMQALEEAIRADRAPNKVLQFNDFGLVAITRKRVKQSLERALCSPCPYCEGAGYVKSVQTVIGEILQEARKLAKVIEGKDATLRVNPEVARVLKSSDNQYLEELEETLRRPVLVVSDASLNQEKFDLV